MYTAVLIEPRKHMAIEFCLKNLLDNLNFDWNILILHGNLNKEYINTILLNFTEHMNRITLKNLEVDSLSSDEYNRLLVSSDFYKLIPTETFLITQTDSMINPLNKKTVYDFIEYDYVGAPWHLPLMPTVYGKVGNGGFSLRKKSKMLKVISECEYKNGQAEDVYFSLSGLLHIPSFNSASKFSCESMFDPKSFGMHQLWRFAQIDSKLNKLIPGIYELSRLQFCE